ncbi:hypothetical protein V7068_08290 [Bacillus sp. JJ634]
MAIKYVQAWGITDSETVIIEGHNQYPDRAEEIIETGLEKVVGNF